MPINNVYEQAYACLMLADPAEKVVAVNRLQTRWENDELGCESLGPVQSVAVPGRPQQPELLHPSEVPRRRLASAQGRIALIHAITHIEFNAINLALDAVYRFRDMPSAYYADWLRVAREEAYHFSLLRDRLLQLGAQYGDLPAHNGLWEMALKTADDVLVRMALVPRVLEARGLDVTPGMMRRLEAVGDHETVAILEIILRDEIGHVAIGSRWYAYACERRACEPASTFRQLLTEYVPAGVHGPFHRQARLEAGFSESELRDLEALDAQSKKSTRGE